MKKILSTLSLLLAFYANAQQEVKVDIADALVMKSLELSYEYYISNQSSLGISALFNFEKESSDFRYNEEQMISPYFRHYFTANRNWNHFGEIFLGINTGSKRVNQEGSDTSVKKDFTDGALGVAVGSKYVSNGGFVVGVYAGVGRNMFTNDSYAVVPRAGVNVGFRF